MVINKSTFWQGNIARTDHYSIKFAKTHPWPSAEIQVYILRAGKLAKTHPSAEIQVNILRAGNLAHFRHHRSIEIDTQVPTSFQPCFSALLGNCYGKVGTVTNVEAFSRFRLDCD